jgi:hypothetical protein
MRHVIHARRRANHSDMTSRGPTVRRSCPPELASPTGATLHQLHPGIQPRQIVELPWLPLSGRRPWAASTGRGALPGRHEVPEALGDLLDRASTVGDVHDQVVHVVVGGAGDRHVVELQEDGRGQPPQPLVAVHQCVVAGDRLEQRRSLGRDTG